MKKSRNQRIGSRVTGLAGLLALFSQPVNSGPTVDFKPVNDVYQTDQPARVDVNEHVPECMEKASHVPARRGSIVMNRYVQRTQFDGRGGILDAYS